MGSTLSILYFYMGELLIGHVGDSKIFRARDGVIEQLTRDQSIVQQMIEKGVITPEQARRHPMRNVLLSCIAHKPDVDVYTREVNVQNGDFYLICSDGVSEYLTQDKMNELSSSGQSPDEICQVIKDVVYNGGAMDNMTAIVIFVDSLNGAKN